MSIGAAAILAGLLVIAIEVVDVTQASLDGSHRHLGWICFVGCEAGAQQGHS
jgi:hypothetical protein